MYSIYIYIYRHVCVYSPQVVQLGPGASTVFGIPMAVQKCIVTSKIKQWRHLIWKDGLDEDVWFLLVILLLGP